ncbi:MAG TPA: DUF4397 domain-containing protein [Terriglobales bacterium]|jgi:hypothetical protein|nr:DUF4397 domain-containing protein [Terriglobales bacterium]
MLRLLKALLLALAVCALSIFSTSCGSGGSAQVRVFNAIPDNGANGSIALDLWFNDNLVITALGVNAITPAATTPAKYLNIASGNDTIVAYDTGTESNPIASNGSEDGLSSSTEYTLLLGGFTDSPPTLYIIPDDNTPPAANFTKVRVIDASAVEGANPLDVYLYQVGTVPPASPQIPTLTLGSVCSASPCSGGYYPLQFTSGQPAYDLEVVRHGGPILYVFSSIAFSAGEIVTVILDDEPGGFTINPSPKVMIDLN